MGNQCSETSKKSQKGNSSCFQQRCDYGCGVEICDQPRKLQSCTESSYIEYYQKCDMITVPEVTYRKTQWRDSLVI